MPQGFARKLLAGLGAVAAIVTAGVAGLYGGYHFLYPKQELARKIETFGPADITVELGKRFPVGTDSRALVNYLKAEKYKFEEPENGFNGAFLRRPGLICDTVVFVKWQTDSNAALTTTSGLYWGRCL